MRVSAGTAALAVGLMVTGALPALATPTADPAPTNIKISWADVAQRTVTITWDEVGQKANEVKLYNEAGAVLDTAPSTEADEPNQAQLEYMNDYGLTKLRFGVTTKTSAGTSPVAYSVYFDATAPANPILEDVVPGAGGTVAVKWRAGAAIADTTPGDPLDRPQKPLFQVLVTTIDGAGARLSPPSATATEYVIKNRAKPYDTLVAASNEWGETYSKASGVRQERFVRATIPARVGYGQPTVITGSIQHLGFVCEDPVVCTTPPTADVGAPVVLQARANASAAWQAVTSTKATASPTTTQWSNFRFSVAAPGTRQYRVVVPNQTYKARGIAVAGVATNAVTTVTTARVMSAKFVDPTATYGQKVTAALRITPPGAVRTTLQRLDGKTWVSVKWVYLKAGAGSYTFTAVRRGAVAYRFVVPAFTYAGRPIAGVTTGSFVLTTR